MTVEYYLVNMEVKSSLCYDLHVLFAGLPGTGSSLSAKAGPAKAPQAAAVGDADADLEARLDNLRRQ